MKIYGYALLHDHMHLLVSFDQEKFSELTISKVVHGLKGHSSKMIYSYITGKQGSYALPESRQGAGALATPKKRFKIWQHGFYDYNIYSLEKFNQKLEYIHKNPIKHGLVPDIAQYKYCSWRNYELEDNSIFNIDYLEY